MKCLDGSSDCEVVGGYLLVSSTLACREVRIWSADNINENVYMHGAVYVHLVVTALWNERFLANVYLLHGNAHTCR